MAYPREVLLDLDTESRLISYLNTELFQHYAERGQLIDDWLKFQSSYWAEPSDEVITFPFRGASKIIVPLNAIAVEAIHARTMTTLFGLNQFITAKATNPDWQEAARPFERYLDHVLLNDIKIKKVANDIILELEKFGTGIGKAGYESIIKYAKIQNGTDEVEVPVTIRNGACLDGVSIGNFLMPFSSLDPQLSPWVGEEHSKTPYEVKVLEDSGFFREGTFEKLKNWVSTQTQNSQNNELERNQADLENTNIVWPNRINWVELWFSFNPNGNLENKEYEMVAHYHRESQTFLSIRYNWYKDLRRPYRKGNYFPVEHRWYGIGICKQNDQFQEEITIMHRQQLDNATLANMRMIKVSRLSGYGPGEPVFPGKMWILDDMTHVDSMQMAEIYPSAYNSEQSTLLFSQQRSGVNETTLGMPQVGTPGTATSDLSRIQEGNKKFGYVYQNIREVIDELVVDVACEIQQFGPKNVEYWDNMENGALVKQVFQFPETFLREGIILEIKSAGQLENKLLDRQNLVQIAQLYNQYGQARLQFATMLMNLNKDPSVFMQTLQALYQGSGEIMQQIFEAFDMRNVDRILGLLGQQNGNQQQNNNMNQMQQLMSGMQNNNSNNNNQNGIISSGQGGINSPIQTVPSGSPITLPTFPSRGIS